ncbi:MAG: hypothetical protein ACK5LX_13670 [Oscillospiraceae bacterium]
MSDDRAKVLHAVIEKCKREGRSEIYCYTIPSGFEDKNELFEYLASYGYHSEILDTSDGYGVLHISL